MDSSTQDKNLPATPRRLQKARQDGQVPRAKDLSNLAVLGGGMVVLFVFVVMTLPISPEAITRERAALKRAWPVPLILSVLVVAPFVFGAFAMPGRHPALPVSAQEVGRLLFGPWALVIELASLLLLAGLIGVRHIGRNERRSLR